MCIQNKANSIVCVEEMQIFYLLWYKPACWLNRMRKFSNVVVAEPRLMVGQNKH